MTIIVSQDEYWQLLYESTRLQHSFNCDFEKNWRYHSQLGRGEEQEFFLREDIFFSIINYQYKDSVTLKLPERNHCLEFCFYLNGSCEQQCLGEIEAGENFIFSSGIAPRDRVTHLAKTKTLVISLHLTVEALNRLISPQITTKNALTQRLVTPIEDWVYCQSMKTSPTLQLILKQILNCQYQGMTKQLYLEGKILELIAVYFEQLEENKRLFRQQLDRKDRDCIYQASEILLMRLSSPPSLQELATLVGINERKLQQGFREVFGTTVFGYLRDRRLEQAKELLLTGQIQVKEAAQAVGYASPTAFNSAFRKKFGMPPSLYHLSC